MGNMTKRIIAFVVMLFLFASCTMILSSCGAQGPAGAQGAAGEKGADGLTPFIGENGNWWIGEVDTGVSAAAQNGRDGVDGKDGANGADGKDGAPGADGKDGIDGKDGTNGVDGKDGIDGKNGADGKDGAPGVDGVDGITPKLLFNNGKLYVSHDNEETWVLLTEIKDGSDGVSISSSEINDAGELVIHYSDGSSDNLGLVVGLDGEDGKNGTDGVGIKAINIDGAGKLTVTLTDDSVIDLGVVKGNDGVNGSNGTNGENGITPRLKINTVTGQWEVSYDNGENWEDLGVAATGANGTNGSNGLNGQNGITPQLKIDSATNEWNVSYDNGETWQSLGVVATGPAGNDGRATIVKIGEDGYWYTSKNNGTTWETTGVKAEGSDGEAGKNGQDGRGIAKMEIIDGYLWVTYTDGMTPVNIGKVSSDTEEGSGGDAPIITEPYTDGLAFYPIGDGSEYAVSVGNALYMESIVIPATYNGKPVSAILPHAFESADGENTTLRNIVIPEGVKRIGNDAFAHCTVLDSITIPSTVEEIGSFAFYNVAHVVFSVTESEVPADQAWTTENLGCLEISWKE